jgi:MFS family permease
VTTVAQRTRPATVAFASLAGTSIEYYDFFIYATASALVFNRLFFPAFDPTVGTLLSLSTFAVAFIARPVGGVVLGHFGDRTGRKSMLVFTLTTMGAATVLIALLPTYDSIGVAAPVLLVVLRFVQGFALGGEYTGAVLMASEHARGRRSGFFASWVQTGAQFGLIIANGVFLLVGGLSEEAMLSWGWRVPFLASVVLVALGLFIRLQIEESPEFERIKEQRRIERSPLATVVRRNPGTILLAAGASVSSGVTFYGLTVFGLSYGVRVLGFSSAEMLTAVILSAALCILLVLSFGAVADRLGVRRVFVAGLVGSAVVAVAWGLMAGSGSFALLVLGYLLLVVPYSAQWSTQGVFLSQAFAGEVRASGMALGFTLGLIIGGGFTPIILTAIADRAGLVGAAGYIAAAALVSAACGAVMSQRDRRVRAPDPART